MNTTIATMLEQLGGFGRLSAMLGASKFLYDNDANSLQFRFKGSRKANAVRFVYDAGSELYSICLYRVAQYVPREVFTADGLDTMQLRAAFESTTGLYLSL